MKSVCRLCKYVSSCGVNASCFISFDAFRWLYAGIN